MKIILDLDGVLVDWCGAVLRTHGRKNPYSDPANLGQWDIVRLLEMRAADFWRPLDNALWWEHLGWTKHGRRLFDLLCLEFGRPNIEIATVMGRRFGYRGYDGCSGSSAMGKTNWISRELGVDLGIHILSCHEKKAFLYLRDKGVLIDDNEYTVTKRMEAGGPAILWPADWNANHKYAEDPMPYCVDELAKYRALAETVDLGALEEVS